MSIETAEQEVINIDDIIDLGKLGEKEKQETDHAIEAMPEDIQEVLSEEERTYLALLLQKDKITFDHSLGVTVEAHNQLEEFSDDFSREGLSREAFLRASALHDIGKLALPDVILQGDKTFDYFERAFAQSIKDDPSFIDDRLHAMGKIKHEASVRDIPLQTLQSWHLNYRDFIPLSQVFSDDKQAQEECERYGLSLDDMSFMDALRVHEERTKDIIRRMDIPDKDVVIEIAGSHHHYSKKEGEDFDQAKEVLRMTELASELLHLNDVYHAITQERRYHTKRSHIEALYFIYSQIHQGEFREDIGKRWMRQSLKSAETENNLSPSEKAMEEELEQFIKE